jgi:hypothetical protein
MSNSQDNRVLSRRGARIVDEKETRLVNGGFTTQTLCTFDPRLGGDGDQFTGDCLAS